MGVFQSVIWVDFSAHTNVSVWELKPKTPPAHHGMQKESFVSKLYRAFHFVAFSFLLVLEFL